MNAAGKRKPVKPLANKATKPHMQFGQKGKGGGVKKGGGNKLKGFGGGMPGVMGFPQEGNTPQNFLPNTPGYESSMRGLNDQMAGADTAYSVANQMIPATTGLQTSRLDTDQAYARNQVDEDLAERGLITSGIRGQMQQKHVSIPYGRQYQDVGLDAAGQYADNASQYGQANLGYDQGQIQALLQRAQDAYGAQPLGASYGTYKAEQMPGFWNTYGNTNKKKKNKKKGGGKK